MTRLRRILSFAAFAATAAGLTWALASIIIVNYPATISVTMTIPSEAITSLQVVASLSNGNNASNSATGSQTVNVTVDGGDPSTSDPGTSYNVSATAYLFNPASSSTWLRGRRSVLVDNTSSTPSVTVPVSFSPSPVYRINSSISVTGNATISSYYLNASPATSPPGESYDAGVEGMNTSQASVATWMPMIPSGTVYVGGTVYLAHSDGTGSQRSLSSQTVNTGGGAASASWTIEMTNTGHLEGTVAAVSPSTPPSWYQVAYSGVSPSTSGINGWISVSTSSPSYAVDLTPGEYDIQLLTLFSSLGSNSESSKYRVVIAAGATVIQDLIEPHGTVFAPLQIGGFFSNASLMPSSYSSLIDKAPPKHALSETLSSGSFHHLASYGTWHKEILHIRLYDNSIPSTPLNAFLDKTYYNSGIAPVNVRTVTGSSSFAAEAVTLSRTNFYFDVIEPPGAPQALITNPVVFLTREVTNPDTSWKHIWQSEFYGSPIAQAQSALVVVGEPGSYTIFKATAYVNGQPTLFPGGGTVTFGTPIDTPAGTPNVVLADDAGGDHLNLSLGFQNVTSPGITAVVENPLGPAPPAGFSLACEAPVVDENGVSICEPIYYDITSNATWSGATKVCIRRRSVVPNGAAQDFLKLSHYNTTTRTWETLPAPTDGTPAFFDCSEDLAACGCSDDADCGINLFPEPPATLPVLAYRICGMTTSFSPFAIFQKKVKLTNTVNGVAYTGPTGPPSLQQWVVPGTGTYRITAAGARGAGPTATPSLQGGCGAEVTGEFALQEGDVLQILVGQKGSSATNSAGGGGGTFVTKRPLLGGASAENGVALLVAGGGGGVRSGALVDGRNASIGTAGVAGSLSSSYAASFVAGGTNGAGGARVVSYGAGGAGWSGNGAADSTYGDGGFAFTGPSQGRGGSAKTCATGGLAHGGYGGGGSGNGCYGGGGGGGYSGGGGGRVGGGGGSLNTGLNPTGREGPSACTPTGHGEVTIDFVRP